MRPDHAKFRNGPPPNLEQQDVMFRKAHVTGESAAIAGQETGGGKEAPILLEDDRGTSSKITGKRMFGAREGNEKESHFSRFTTMLSTHLFQGMKVVLPPRLTRSQL